VDPCAQCADPTERARRDVEPRLTNPRDHRGDARGGQCQAHEREARRVEHGDDGDRTDVVDDGERQQQHPKAAGTRRPKSTRTRAATAVSRPRSRRSRAAYRGAVDRLVHLFHAGGHSYRVGAPSADVDVPNGVSTPALTAPDGSNPLAWQTDAAAIQRRTSVFDLMTRGRDRVAQ